MNAEDSPMRKTISKTKRHRTNSISAFSLLLLLFSSLVVSTVFSLPIAVKSASNKMEYDASTLLDKVKAVSEYYIHTYLLFEQILLQKIKLTEDPDEIETYLKNMDKRLLSIEGADYDGVYMYYKGRYLYSWDTPYSVYEDNGYDAKTRPWYIGAAKAKGEVYITQPYPSYANDYMLATISRLQEDGKSVIAYDIKMSSLQNCVETYANEEFASSFACDNEGNIICSTDTVFLGENYLLSAEQLTRSKTEAQGSLDAAKDTKAQERAKRTLESAEAMIALKTKYGELLEKVTATPQVLQFDIKSRTFGYLCNTDSMSCLMLLSVKDFCAMEYSIWLILLFLSLAIGLIIQIEIMRTRHSRVIKANQADMEKALVAADVASKAKTQFMAQMSHEIRTPMNAIIGLAAIARTELSQTDKVGEELDKIESSSRLLLSIINDVLDMSAIEGGKIRIDNTQFDLKQLLTNTAASFYRQAKAKDVSFFLHLRGLTQESVIGDELRVTQILMNLLSNAVKFTPPGGKVELTITQASVRQDKVQIRFSVADTGCGISEEMQGRLFQPFEQQSASTARKYGGSGLGLAITKNLIDMMDGTISIKSTLGIGTVFDVDIAFDIPQRAVSKLPERRTLVVDEQMESCEYLSLLLTRMGVPHDCVASSQAALEALGEAEDRDQPYKICIIDSGMSFVDSVPLSVKIRELFAHDICLILISTLDSSNRDALGKVEYVDYCINKPLSQSALFDMLMEISKSHCTGEDHIPSADRYDFSGRHVLIAEDVPLNMEVAVKLLRNANLGVVCAETGKQAVEQFVISEVGFFDCILMDINMPAMDGYEATGAIRALKRDDAMTIPIYALSANAFSEDVTRALNIGMNGHIAKPLDISVLYATLTAAFEAKEQGDAQHPGTEP